MANGNSTQQPGNNPSDTGGAAGQGMFASLEELDRLIKTWMNEYDSITEDGFDLGVNARLDAPSNDFLTIEYVEAIQQSIGLLSDHNRGMLDFTGNYAEKLAASREAIAGTETGSEASFNGLGI